MKKVGDTSFVALSWEKIALAVLPGLLVTGTTQVVNARHIVAIADLSFCLLLLTVSLLAEHRVPVWGFTTLGILFGILTRRFWMILGLVGLPLAIFGVILLWRRNIHLPRRVWILASIMILGPLTGAAVSFLWSGHHSWWGLGELSSGGTMLFTVIFGLLLSRRGGLLAGLFVLAASFVLWEDILYLTYGLAHTHWEVVLILLPAALLLVVSPVWVLRSCTGRGRVAGLLVPAFLTLIGVISIPAILRADPTLLDPNFTLESLADPFVRNISMGSLGKADLVPLLMRGYMTGAQLFLGVILAVVLYGWVERRGLAADIRKDRGMLGETATSPTARNTG